MVIKIKLRNELKQNDYIFYIQRLWIRKCSYIFYHFPLSFSVLLNILFAVAVLENETVNFVASINGTLLFFTVILIFSINRFVFSYRVKHCTSYKIWSLLSLQLLISLYIRAVSSHSIPFPTLMILKVWL